MIKNISKNTVIASREKTLKNPLIKFKGLMFSKPPKDTGLVFLFDKEKRINLHMFFVFFPIDVIFLDKHKKVVEIKENFKPFTLYSPKSKAKFILELPVGSVKNSNTKVGDSISF